MTNRILIVDDEAEVLQAVEFVLQLKGYQTVTARDGARCLQILEQQPVDLIVLDLMMPQMDGWEVLRQLRACERLRDIPVMVLTAKTQSIDKMLGIKVFGVRDYVTKPFDKDDLLARVARIVSEG